ncbi:hypothetical protein SPHINGO391_520167 [Sphingomonas aurantiaca]|jgi:hypothetical protein|uniref:Uncharacterized protein n=1 Tax=Sphingomonas aurantiaca TaxID=185949 RepID=A0A5E8AJX4_9SPHN|nr:hypothetical protein [Sphingomonas aurantiaca]VVT31433.1 hypothetical protein SPHINGO391_520167 [Sphingomonas aurantiaca]
MAAEAIATSSAHAQDVYGSDADRSRVAIGVGLGAGVLYGRLRGDCKRSPIVSYVGDADQFAAAVGLTLPTMSTARSMSLLAG